MLHGYIAEITGFCVSCVWSCFGGLRDLFTSEAVSVNTESSVRQGVVNFSITWRSTNAPGLYCHSRLSQRNLLFDAH